MPRRGSPYGPEYERVRRAVLAAGVPCQLRLRCDGARATSADHDPPLALHAHVPGSGCCVLRPACHRCQCAQGHAMQKAVRAGRRPRAVPPPSRDW